MKISWEWDKSARDRVAEGTRRMRGSPGTVAAGDEAKRAGHDK